MKIMVLLAALGAVDIQAQVLGPNSAGVSMGHLHVITRNPDAHRKIWIETLGAAAVKIGPMPFAKVPGVLIGFRDGDSNGGTEGSIVDHLGFLVRDLDATKAKLVGAGVKIAREMPETRQFFAMFPDNVKVEFSEDKKLDVPLKHHHIHFASHQIDAMRAWYAKIFGAVPGMRGKFKAADVPGVNLSWNPADKATLPTAGRAMDHIGFEVRNLKAFSQKLISEGIKFDTPPTDRPDLGLTIAFLTDPWGAKIELTEGLSKF